MLTWNCDTCHQPIAAGTGYIHLSLHDVGRAEAEHDRDIAENYGKSPRFISGAELLAADPTVHWQAHHRACDPRPDECDYWFGVERIDSHAKLLSWTAHLLGKGYLHFTDWDALIRSQLTEKQLFA